MSNQTLKTRIIHKHEPEINWLKAKEFVPLKSEIIIYDAEADENGKLLEGIILPENRTIPYTQARIKIGDGITKVSDLPFIDEYKPGMKTTEGGEIFNDYENNKALAENTSVSGIGNQAGYYGIFIDSISMSNDLSKATIRSTYSAGLEDKILSYYSIGDIVQLDVQSHFYNRYKINDIEKILYKNGIYMGVEIEISPLYGDKITDDLSMSDGDDNWLYVVGKPVGHKITHSTGASTRGKNNIAIGAQSDVSGKNNIAIGDLSSVIGRDNKAGYAASAGGGYSEAMPSYSNVHGYRLKAGRNSQAVYGEFNTEDKDALLVIGNGTSDSSRSNAFTVSMDGSANIQSKLSINGIDVGSKLYECPFERVDKLPEKGDIDKVYITSEGQYIYGLKNKNTSTEEIEIWDGTTRTKPKVVNGVYEITNGAELAYIVYNGGQEGAYYKLTKDIYLNDIKKIGWTNGSVDNGYTARKWFQNWGWSPTGGQTMATATAFKGTIDGDGHIIYGLYVNCKVNTYATSTAYGAALIPKADKNVVIKNLGIDYCYINSQYIASAFVSTVNGGGTLVFDSCYIGGNNTSLSGNNVGVFIGQPQNFGCNTSITNCYCKPIVTNTTGNVGFYISTWGGVNVRNCYSFIPFSSNTTTSGVLLQNCYQFETEVGLKNGIIYRGGSKSHGLDVLTNPDKMPGLNTTPPTYVAIGETSMPELIIFAYGWVKIESGVTKEYVNNKIKEETTHISNQLNLKGVATGIGGTPDAAIVINDISSVPHYIKCKIEYEDLGKNIEINVLPEGHEVYEGLRGESGYLDIAYVSLDDLDINKYYYINVKFKDNVRGNVYIDKYSWDAREAPYHSNNNSIMSPTLDKDINTLYIVDAKLEDIDSVSIIPVSGPTDKPIAYNNIVVSVGNHAFFATESGIIENIESIYPSMTINADASVNITCEYVKDTEFADIIGMIVPRYLAENNV